MGLKKKSILILLHAYDNRGGTEEHAKTLGRAINDEYDPIFVFRTKADEDTITIIHDEKRIVVHAPRVPFPFTPTNERDESIERIIRDVISTFNPSLIHIQHWLYWPLTIIEQLASFKIPLVLSLHDFYFFSPQFTLQGATPDSSLTPEYARNVFGEDCSHYLLERRRLMLAALQLPHRVIVPSTFLEGIMSPYRHTQVIEHGIEPFSCLPKLKKSVPTFGYLGGMLPQKGAGLIVELGKVFASIYPNESIKIFGASGEAPGCSFFGGYTQADKSRIFAEIDILLIPSLFQETYSLLLSEGWYSHTYPIASNIGALAERITPTTGTLVPAGSFQDLLSSVTHLRSNFTATPFAPPEIRLASDMGAQYLSLFEELLRAG